MNNMKEKDMQTLLDQYYRYIGIANKKTKKRILNLLSYCKEIRDTAYPMRGSQVTELELVEFSAHKDTDFIYINGSLHLTDGPQSENRTFDAYIIEEKEEGKTRIYLDITRLCVDDEPKMIRTSDDIYEKENSIVDVTSYTSTDATEEKVFTAEFPKEETEEYVIKKITRQISAI